MIERCRPERAKSVVNLELERLPTESTLASEDIAASEPETNADRRNYHSTFFSQGRTLGPAAFHAPCSRNHTRPQGFVCLVV